MSRRRQEIQYWDTSALIGIVFQESHTPAALKARDEGKRWLGWDWMQIEAHAAVARRGGKSADFKSLRLLLDQFEFLSFGRGEYPDLMKILGKHRLRSAGAGHLFCLLKAKKLVRDLAFVCFDAELNRAAEAEGVRLFG